MMASGEDPARLRNLLVDELVNKGAATTPSVIRALRAVPRHVFLPEISADAVYQNRAIPIAWDGLLPSASSSQPEIMARMLDMLEAEVGHRVLEIGTGSGYGAALLSEIVGPDGTVVTMELDEAICGRARRALAQWGRGAIRIVCEDGGQGCGAFAPYDRIVATAAFSAPCPAWLAQAAPHARIVFPCEVGPLQAVYTLVRAGPRWRSDMGPACSFQPARGVSSGTARRIALPAAGSEDKLGVVLLSQLAEPDADKLGRLLRSRSVVSERMAFGAADDCQAFQMSLAADRPSTLFLVGCLDGSTGFVGNAFGVATPQASGAAVLVTGPGLCAATCECRSYGSMTALAQLRAARAAWDAHGRPARRVLPWEHAIATAAPTIPADE